MLNTSMYKKSLASTDDGKLRGTLQGYAECYYLRNVARCSTSLLFFVHFLITCNLDSQFYYC